MSEINREDVVAALMKRGDERRDKATAELERGHALSREGDKRKGQLAIDHAWSIRNQADGLWEAAHLVRDLETDVSGGDRG